MKADLAHGLDFSFSRTWGETNIKIPSPLRLNHFTQGSPSPSGMPPALVRQTTTPPVLLNSATKVPLCRPKVADIGTSRTSYLGRLLRPPPRMNQRRQPPRSLQRLSSDNARGKRPSGSENRRNPS